MKKIALIVLVFVGTLANAQVQQNPQPQITVNGEGKILVAPDQADITVGVTNTGADANEVKKLNDAAIDAVIKFLKAQKLAQSDYQTQRVNLNKNYDYTKKKYSFVASQTIVIHLKDLAKYDALMMGLTDAGVNTINGVAFKTSKQQQYESEARVKAVADAQKKATDYTTALGQKLGKAITVTDNSQTYYPQPMMRTAMLKTEMADMPQETLAIGEIEITANVNISFALN
ncbi:SIMPL domain-containing protein [Flavobacterium subsaxonicum]|uniref:Membrane protein n=1 Tax=Flavobacterium subsaxonicum WB 4.1-42 = DSM 21790 TaxID=1121898 RepID=A0A0A2MM54_9FLAO|nr:SIMPL domain-containing protein [Flavobacterium subsaxonicum]KGO93702.1 membrane protein [Flavobacterium subsaxonicum WB 4.1-42 = DSM 21790]